jgi:predicted O-methyltransferase YrrM
MAFILHRFSMLVKKVKKFINQQGFIALLKHPFIYSREILYIISSKFIITKLGQNYSLNSLMDFTFNLNNGYIMPFQKESELLRLLNQVKKKSPKVILEIGTASGGTLFLFTRVASSDATIISIDLPEGSYGGGYSKKKEYLYKSFRLPNQRLYLLRCDSHEDGTFLKVKGILNKQPIDFLFIDGDHSYEGVKQDFEMYSPLVNKDGLIAFHDIVIHHIYKDVDVIRFWNEIKVKYDHEEIIDDVDQGMFGIGLLRKT